MRFVREHNNLTTTRTVPRTSKAEKLEIWNKMKILMNNEVLWAIGLDIVTYE